MNCQQSDNEKDQLTDLVSIINSKLKILDIKNFEFDISMSYEMIFKLVDNMTNVFLNRNNDTRYNANVEKLSQNFKQTKAKYEIVKKELSNKCNNEKIIQKELKRKDKEISRLLEIKHNQSNSKHSFKNKVENVNLINDIDQKEQYKQFCNFNINNQNEIIHELTEENKLLKKQIEETNFSMAKIINDFKDNQNHIFNIENEKIDQDIQKFKKNLNFNINFKDTFLNQIIENLKQFSEKIQLLNEISLEYNRLNIVGKRLSQFQNSTPVEEIIILFNNQITQLEQLNSKSSEDKESSFKSNNYKCESNDSNDYITFMKTLNSNRNTSSKRYKNQNIQSDIDKNLIFSNNQVKEKENLNQEITLNPNSKDSNQYTPEITNQKSQGVTSPESIVQSKFNQHSSINLNNKINTNSTKKVKFTNNQLNSENNSSKTKIQSSSPKNLNFDFKKPSSKNSKEGQSSIKKDQKMGDTSFKKNLSQSFDCKTINLKRLCNLNAIQEENSFPRESEHIENQNQQDNRLDSKRENYDDFISRYTARLEQTQKLLIEDEEDQNQIKQRVDTMKVQQVRKFDGNVYVRDTGSLFQETNHDINAMSPNDRNNQLFDCN